MNTIKEDVEVTGVLLGGTEASCFGWPGLTGRGRAGDRRGLPPQWQTAAVGKGERRVAGLWGGTGAQSLDANRAKIPRPPSVAGHESAPRPPAAPTPACCCYSCGCCCWWLWTLARCHCPAVTHP